MNDPKTGMADSLPLACTADCQSAARLGKGPNVTKFSAISPNRSVRAARKG